MDPTNSLGQETSPYLRQHADNPVAWQAWNPTTLDRAKASGKPIFLSVGYSTCHWCHVMAHESFESPAIAEVLNRDFTPIKVDREERPDVDHLYMLFVQATTGQGGWPMSVWLTPDLKPFYGGTYFPPEDRWGRPGFNTVLERISELWRTERESIVQQSDQIFLSLAQTTTSAPGATLPDANQLEAAFRQFVAQYDASFGGFSGAPKFPRPSVLNLLLRYADRNSTSPENRHQARDMVINTLKHMAIGGIYDHLGGGFHRYSVDGFWHVPHFEKMLYDQAQLVCSYLEGYQLTGYSPFARVIRETLDYVRRDLSSPEGAFFAAEDADSLKAYGGHEHAEGAFYVWEEGEILEVLGSEAGRQFCERYGVRRSGNAPEGSDPHGEFDGKNILIQRGELTGVEQAMAVCRHDLFEARTRRPRPHRDEKILVAWNGLMISAFARSGAVLNHPDDIVAAERAADFILTRMSDSDGRLIRTYCGGPGKVLGFASDYAFLIQGLLDLFEATGTIRWLRIAWRLQQMMDRLFWDASNGGYFESAEEDSSLLLRLKETYDGAEPAANSVAASNILRLADLLGESTLGQGASRIFQAASAPILGSPGAVPQLLASLTRLLSPPLHVVVVGEQSDPRTAALVEEAQAVFLPQKTFVLLRPGQSLSFMGTQADFFEGLVESCTQPTAFVCEELRCHQPVTSPETLRQLLSPLK